MNDLAMTRLIDCLAENEAALIYTNVNRRYITGFSSSLGYLLVSKKRQSLFVDGRYFEAAQKCVKNADVFLLKNLSQQLVDFIKTNSVELLLLESEISLKTADTVKEIAGCKIDSKRLSYELCLLRKIKTEKELGYVIEAQRIAEKALADLLNFIAPNVSEKRLAAELEYKIKLYGAEGISFDTVAVSGKNGSLPHGVPSDRLLCKGDFVTFDFGAVINGYHSDMTRTVAVGYADEVMKEVYDIVLCAEIAGEQAALCGNRCLDVDMAARTIISDGGYGQYFVHSTGHGVGLEIHEAPSVTKNSDEILQEGYLITCEPGIYLPEKFGIRIEDTLYIRKNGPENITKFEKNLIIV